jgi:ABC-2 type transport system ATP-binding protein
MIKLINFSKYYDSQLVLQDVNLEISKGSIFGLIGPNGSGKTTMIKSILDQTNYKGQILINNIPNNEFINDRNKEIVYLPENLFVYEYLTGYEFINFCIDLKDCKIDNRKEKIDLLLELFELKEAKNKLIHYYSLGMKRKISIITSLVQNPLLLILDEPVSGVDAKSIVILKKLLVSLSQGGCTIFITSHIIDFISNICDHVVILHNKTIACNEKNFSGNKNELDKIYIEIIGKNVDTSIENFVSLKTIGSGKE